MGSLPRPCPLASACHVVMGLVRERLTRGANESPTKMRALQPALHAVGLLSARKQSDSEVASTDMPHLERAPPTSFASGAG